MHSSIHYDMCVPFDEDRVKEVISSLLMYDDSCIEFENEWLGDKPNPELVDIFASVVKEVHSKFGGTVNHGGSRVVIVTDDYVYKIPVADRGRAAIMNEANWDEDKHRFPMAQAEIVDHIYDLPILRMERVEPVAEDELDFDEQPSWAEAHINSDGWQVGRRRDGTLVAYDAYA